MSVLSKYIETSFNKYVKRICEDCIFGLFFSVYGIIISSAMVCTFQLVHFMFGLALLFVYVFLLFF